jgi:GR25 family glycosyltransferase involved in LPS biosynthesis
MDCLYINLDAQTERRAALECNFDAKKADGWRLFRFKAVEASQVDALNIAGNARPAEKACFASHKTLLRENIGRDTPVMIMEDDAIIGNRTCMAIDTGIRNIDSNSWDILFTDICVPNVGAWADLVRIRRQFMKSGELRFLDLSQIPFAGTTSYIVNPKSIAKLCDLIDEVTSIDLAYDLYLRNATYQSRLRSSVFIPFVTSISHLSQKSSIQENSDGSPGEVLDLFRKMMWLDRDLSLHTELIESLREEHSNEESRMFGALFEAVLSDKLRWN